MAYVQEWFAKLPELADGGVEVIRMAILGAEKSSILKQEGRAYIND